MRYCLISGPFAITPPGVSDTDNLYLITLGYGVATSRKQ